VRTHTLLVGKPKGKRPIGRSRCMWVDSTVMCQWGSVTYKTFGLNWLLDLFASSNMQSQFQSLALPLHSTVHNSLGHFFSCFWNCWKLVQRPLILSTASHQFSWSSIPLERSRSSTSIT
jgi:hypothetical protein